MRPEFLLVFAFFALNVSMECQAQSLKKCVGSDGKVIYTDKVCGASLKTNQVNISENVISGSFERASAQRFREQEEAEAQAATQRQYQDTDYSTGNDNKNYKDCVSEVERSRGLSSRQKAEFLVRCQGVTSAGTSNASSNKDECISKINSMSGLSSRQRANALIGCRGGEMTSTNDGLQMPSNARPNPSSISSCDSGGCWDNLGGRYNKGAGNTFFRNDGKVCQSSGGRMQCN